ncbi:N-acetyl-D-glucosamine kinase [Strongyloides ratti]|uniref:N-acetyl-D-glucosamine kinase n=1 Tax=Strongyloides ratti TaxID=34506 RepID=A0A090KP91_STRRB|nr:N-acetyl-D-glucosamine kinase [Strongyloides ratti]CEF59418.1 N-acetyl-D-glucosamine kinase [Strongyloides ratti]
MKKSLIYAGIEGGATTFKIMIMNENGNILGQWEKDGFNFAIIGIQKTAERVSSYIEDIKKENNLCFSFAALGLGLAGAEDNDVNDKLVKYFTENYSHLASYFYESGIVLISGTGSSCRLLKENGKIHYVGGWGHIISDGGSAIWLSIKAIKLLFDLEDGLIEVPYSHETLKKTILNHFEVNNHVKLIDVIYGVNFNKANIASLCKVLALNVSNDPLIEKIFFECGEELGKHLVAIIKNVDEEMLNNVPVLIVGSMFKSWNFIKKGFWSIIENNQKTYGYKKITLYQQNASPAIGAIRLATKYAGLKFENEIPSKIFDEYIF